MSYNILGREGLLYTFRDILGLDTSKDILGLKA